MPSNVLKRHFRIYFPVFFAQTRACFRGLAMSDRLSTRMLTGAMFTLVLLGSSSFLAQEQSGGPPIVVADKTGYFAGETVAITGNGFAGEELITLQVKHVDGGAEPGAGHDPFAVWTDADGSFSASWAVGDDVAGHNFHLSVSGAATGSLPALAFGRIATVGTDKYDYQPGETAFISGAGFRAGEAVTVRVEHSNGDNDGEGHEAFAILAGPDGHILAPWFVHPDDSEESIFRLIATGTDTGLVATSTFTDVLVTIIDDAGPDDEPGQKDLSQMSFDLGLTAIALTWNWDDTAWSGSNTGDACALVDTDTDGNANYSFCVTVGGSPAAKISHQLYLCSDTSPTKCFSASAIATTSTSTASVVNNADPFGSHVLHTGNVCKDTTGCLTADTVANVTLQLSDVGGASAKLTNVCSYPSQEPNSDPSECVIAAGNGLLTIVKVADVNDGTAFVFNLGSGQTSQNGTSSWTINGSGSVSNISFAPGTAYDLSEVIPTGWDLTSASCAIQTSPATGIGTSTATGVDNFTIQAGLETICTFNDTKDPTEVSGRIIVKKETEPDDATSFEFNPSWSNSNFFLSDGQLNDSGYTLTPNTYSVTETAATGWSMSSDCISSNSDTETIDNISLQAGETVTCTFTNAQNASLTIVKDATPNDAQDFTFDPSANLNSDANFTLDDDAGAVGENATYSSSMAFSNLAPGTYAVSEINLPAGWTLSSISCPTATVTIGAAGGFDPGDTGASVTLAAGQNITCTFTNRKHASVRIEKVSIGGIGTFTFTNTIPTGPTSLTTQTAGVAVGQTVSNVAPGTYTVTEVGPPAGWNFTSLNCTGGGPNTTTSGQTSTIGVDPGETINCTYTNTKVQEVCGNDTKAPSVSVYATLKNPTRVQLKVIDTGSGVKTIEVIVMQNTTVFVPPFAQGTTNQIIVEATKINESSSSQVGLRVTDMCGNVTVFDPVTVTVNAGGKREGIQFNDVPGDETLVQIQNLGLQHLRITVNGRTVNVQNLGDTETRTIDIGWLMNGASSSNVILLEPRGPKGSTAVVTVYPPPALADVTPSERTRPGKRATVVVFPD